MKRAVSGRMICTGMMLIFVFCFSAQADLTDSDWGMVNDLLRNARNAAGSDAALHTQCSAAAVCLEVSRWLYELGQQAPYRQDLINQAYDILNLVGFSSAPWAVYDSQYATTILATEDMAYLFRHEGTDYVFLDSVYFYDASLGGTPSDHTERQRLFGRPATTVQRPLWAVECSQPDHSNDITLYSYDAYSMNTPVIGGTSGCNAWVEFKWDDLVVPGTDRHIRIKVKVEVYTGVQSVAGISRADSRHGSWWINAKNESGDDVNIWQVEFPILERLEPFHRFPSDPAYLAVPKQSGAELVVGQSDDNKFGSLEYPGGAEFQFAAQYQRNAGLLYYCDDRDGYRKSLKTIDNDTGTTLSWVHYPKMQGGSSAQVKLLNTDDLGYACRMGVFEGDWYDATVWYREQWLDDSYADFLPDAIRGGWLLDAHHGTYTWEQLETGYDDWLEVQLDIHFPGTDWVGSHSAYKWRRDFSPEGIVYNGQWVYEPWIENVSQAGRDYEYNPIPGNHYFTTRKLNQFHNSRVILYIGARLICRLFNNYGEYPDSPHYSFDGSVWKVSNPEGSQPYIPEYQGQDLIGDRGFVCPSAGGWRDLLASQVEQMVARANYGTRSYPAGVYMDVACTRPGYGGPCYNTHPDHGHPDQRGGGNHYAVGTNAMLDAVRTAGQYGGSNPDFAVISEGNADVFLRHIDSYIHFSIKDDSVTQIPVSQVLWADKVRSYGDKFAGVLWGNDPTRVKTARAFVYGVAMGRIRENTLTDNGNQIRAIKRMVWYRRHFDEFLATGQMCRPPMTDKDHNEVLCATWKSGNRVLYAFANGTDSTLTVNADMELNSAGILNPLAYKLYEVEQDGSYEAEANATSFQTDGTVQETFTLEPLGDIAGNKGVLCFVAKNLCGPATSDLFVDGQVNMYDFVVLAQQWLESDCGHSNNCCDGADLNENGSVDLEDFTMFIYDWLL